MICNLCPRNCNSERNENRNLNGYCKMPLLPRVAKADLHFWEEPFISGTNGSGTVFFSGCSLGCVFCQNYDLSHNQLGKTVSVERLAEIFYELEKRNAHNINLVNPTHYVHAIKSALDIYRPNIPIVYNSGGYDKVESLKKLENYIDIYLMDLKYLNSDIALKYSNAYDYPFVAQAAIRECYRQKSECKIENGIMKKGLIIRHLILPQSTREAMCVFDWYIKNTPNAYFSMMSQYMPYGKAIDMQPINRKITKRENEKVIDYILSHSCDRVYVQETNSGNKKYIPNFDFGGV